MKTWKEKQQERDKLSSVMGEYLLKGYRMLDSYCSKCGVSGVVLVKVWCKWSCISQSVV